MTSTEQNHGRLVKLASLLGLLILVNVAVFAGLFSDRGINLHWRAIAQVTDAQGPYVLVQFATSDTRPIRSIEVQRLTDDGEPAQTLWRVEGKTPPMDTFSFGSNLTGMQRTDATDGRPRLQPGNRYRIKLTASGWRGGELDFEL